MSIYSEMADGCCSTIVNAIIIGIITAVIFYGSIIFIDHYVIKRPHCIKCNIELTGKENFCPNCGYPTDSVNMYNYFNKKKL